MSFVFSKHVMPMPVCGLGVTQHCLREPHARCRAEKWLKEITVCGYVPDGVIPWTLYVKSVAALLGARSVND